MAEFEDKLNSILGNQEAMGQIMALARSLSGDLSPAPQPNQETQPENPPPQGESSPERQGDVPDLAALLGQVDPQMIRIGMEVIQQVQAADDRNTALLNALRPFLREEKRARLDRAMQITRMTRLVRAAIGALGGKEEDRV